MLVHGNFYAIDKNRILWKIKQKHEVSCWHMNNELKLTL